MRLQRRRPGDLVHVEGRAVGEDSEVDGLTGALGKGSADCAALLHEVEPRGRGAGQPEDARAEPVLAAVGVLLDQLAALEGGDEAERR